MDVKKSSAWLYYCVAHGPESHDAPFRCIDVSRQQLPIDSGNTLKMGTTCHKNG